MISPSFSSYLIYSFIRDLKYLNKNVTSKFHSRRHNRNNLSQCGSIPFSLKIQYVIIIITTINLFNVIYVDSFTGPKPGPPKNLTVTEVSNGFLITWEAPSERNHLIQHYTIKYKTDGPWKNLNKGQIRPEETSYLGKLKG